MAEEEKKTEGTGAAPAGGDAAGSQKSDKSSAELMGQIKDDGAGLEAGPAKSSVDAMADGSTAPADPNAPAVFIPQPKGIKKILGKFNIYLLLFILILVVVGAVFAISYGMNKKESNIKIETQKLTEDALNQLKTSDAVVGDPKQILTVESNLLVTGKVVTKDSLDVAGALRIGGALSLPSIKAAGEGNFGSLATNDLQAGGDVAIAGILDVVGATTLGADLSAKGNINGGGKLDIKGAATIGSNLNVNGIISARGINFNEISINRINITGNNPGVSVAGGAGGGATASLNGTDTAGTVTINTGGAPSASVLATITFSGAFNSSNPHPVLTPNGPGCANIGYYVTNISATQFAIASASTPPSGATCRFNYIVIN